MSQIKKLLSDKQDVISHADVLKKFDWIISKNRNCILSPDSDGLMCGLLMSKLLNWKIKGFYDGKILLYDKNIIPSECIFLDIEIFRKNFKSLGQHMIVPNNKIYYEYGDNALENCISPNNLRKYDANKNFRLKFPLASIHFLISILYKEIKITLPNTAIWPLLFVDGLFNVIFSYPENVSNWFKFLKIDKEENPLNKLFFSDKKTFTEIMVGMFDFFNNRDKLKGKGRRDRGDRIILSDKDGAVNIHKKKETYFIDTDNKNRAEKFIKYISNLLEWDYKKDNWTWDNFNLITFNKQKLDSSAGIPKNKRFIIPNIINVYKNKPFSMAVTAGNRMEYTLLKEKINLLN